jgi:integrase
MTMGELLDRWMEVRRTEGKVRGPTLLGYRILIDKHLRPRLDAVPLKRFTEPLAQEVIDAIARAATASVAQRAAFLLSMVCDQALTWKLLVRNPLKAVTRPHVERGRGARENVWSEDEARAFLAATQGDPLYPLFAIALNTGLRAGEACALSWDRVDTARGTILIDRTWTRTEDNRLFISEMDDTKTRAARRLLRVSDAVLAVLRDVRADQRRRGLVTPWVFDDLTGTGAPRKPWALADRTRNRARKHGLPAINFHGLRHTFATAMLARGVPPVTVQHYLGHAKASTTQDTYGHVLPAMHLVILDAVVDAFGAPPASDATTTGA